MSAIPSHRLVPAFSAFAWNADRTCLAVCPNSQDVWIFTGCADPDPATWVKQYVLKQHDLLVSGIDWHPVTDKIVTCSHDRNAFVWHRDPATDTWIPTVALLRINRAAINVKWSPDGLKFAVATGTKNVCVCTLELANNWWVSNHIKEHRSTVLCVNWHPNSQILVTGCCDFKARIMSATSKDEPALPGPFAAPQSFGKLYADFTAGGWVTDAVWSPSGMELAYTSHDSTITFVNLRSGEVTTIAHRDLPYTRLLYLTDRCLAAVGHGKNPTLYTANETTGAWAQFCLLDKGDKSAAKSTSKFGTARDMFVSKTRHGVEGVVEGVTTIHQSSIALLSACSTSYPITCFATGSIDGTIALWNLARLDLDMSAAGLMELDL